MKLQTVKNIIIGAVCAALAAGNIYQYARVPDDRTQNIVFYEAEPSSGIYEEREMPEISGDTENNNSRPSLININIATKDELESLPGIGPVKARAIIEYRKAYGGFVAAEEIMEVRGIGQSIYDKIKDRITVN